MCTILHLFAHVYMYVCRPVCGWYFPRLLSFYCRFWTAWGCCTCVEMCLVKCYLAITIMLVRVYVVVHLCSFLPTCWGHHVCGTLWKVPEIAEERQDKSGARTAGPFHKLEFAFGDQGVSINPSAFGDQGFSIKPSAFGDQGFSIKTLCLWWWGFFHKTLCLWWWGFFPKILCLWWSGFLPKTLWSLEKKPEQCCLQWSVFTTYTWCQLWKWGWD